MQVLVLASGSPYRAELLQRLNQPFAQLSPDIDESARENEPAKALASRLAQEKAAAVRHLVDDFTIIIASDQVAVLGQTYLGKPGTAELAREQLFSMSGQCVHFFTSLCLLDTRTGKQFNAIDTTITQLRTLDRATVDRYIDADQPQHCAGSFRVESLGISLFDSIRSDDPTALIGLPMILLCRGLRELGMTIP